MAMTNPFSGTGFDMVSLTEAINLLPYVPKRLGQMGLFEPQGIDTSIATFEENNGVLSLLPSVPRGAPATPHARGGRALRAFPVPHIPLESRILASDVQDKRAFGSENALEVPTTVMNDRLAEMRRQHEATEEWLRMGAINGVIVDGDGSTELFDLFTEFGITAITDVDFALTTETTKVGTLVMGLVEEIEDRLAEAEYDHIHALCSPGFFNLFIEHPEVKYAFQYYQESRVLREDMRAGFEYKGVVWERYRGKVGSTAFITDGDARFFPVGVPGLFKTAYAPGDFMETANTIGLPIYAKQEPEAFNRGTRLHTQSNPLPVCTQPGVLVRGYSALS